MGKDQVVFAFLTGGWAPPWPKGTLAKTVSGFVSPQLNKGQGPSLQVLKYTVSWHFVFSKQDTVEVETLILKAILQF